MNLAAKILGGVLLLFSISMWYGHRQYVKREIRFQYTTAYQMILVTFTSLGLLLGCHLWILPIAVVLWFFMGVFVINWIHSNRKLFDPSYILFFVILRRLSEKKLFFVNKMGTTCENWKRIRPY